MMIENHQCSKNMRRKNITINLINIYNKINDN